MLWFRLVLVRIGIFAEWNQDRLLRAETRAFLSGLAWFSYPRGVNSAPIVSVPAISVSFHESFIGVYGEIFSLSGFI